MLFSIGILVLTHYKMQELHRKDAVIKQNQTFIKNEGPRGSSSTSQNLVVPVSSSASLLMRTSQ